MTGYSGAELRCARSGRILVATGPDGRHRGVGHGFGAVSVGKALAEVN